MMSSGPKSQETQKPNAKTWGFLAFSEATYTLEAPKAAKNAGITESGSRVNVEGFYTGA